MAKKKTTNSTAVAKRKATAVTRQRQLGAVKLYVSPGTGAIVRGEKGQEERFEANRHDDWSITVPKSELAEFLQMGCTTQPQTGR